MNHRRIKFVFLFSFSLIIFVIICYVYALYTGGFISFKYSVSPDISDKVGSFIGGIVGSIISLTVLFIVYYTYESQIEQNKHLRQTAIIDFMMKSHEIIVADISQLEFLDHRGEKAIMCFKHDLKNHKNVFIDKLNYIINSYDLLIKDCKIEDGKSENEIFKKLLIKFYLSFYTKIIWPVIEDEAFKNYMYLKHHHDDSKYIFNTFSTLSKEAIAFLGNRKIIEIDNSWKTASLKKIDELGSAMIIPK